MTIGKLAGAAGVRSSAIRYYERVGLLPVPFRVHGQRRYGHETLERIAIIRFAQRVGFKIAEIKLLLCGIEGRPPPERWRKMAVRKMVEINELMREARTIRALLEKTMQHECPKLVERGKSLMCDRIRRRANPPPRASGSSKPTV